MSGCPDLPLMIEPAVDHLDLPRWAAANGRLVEGLLLKHGALLFRGSGIHSPELFRKCVQALSDKLIEYNERAAPRREVSSGVYTSTEFPAELPISFHHEMSYSHNWPTRLWFPRVPAPSSATDRRAIHGKARDVRP